MIRKVLIASALVALAACAKRGAKAPQPSAPMGMQGSMMRGGMTMCPAMLPGVETAVTDTADGAIVELKAPPEEVQELQTRVETMAEHHERQPVGGGPGMMKGEPGARMWPEADTSVERTEEGARLIFTARDPGEVPALQERVRDHVERMRAGGCKMMAPGAASPQ